ncbi:MAG TPA: hypothetical protein VE981_03605 [Planctomycetota bacterium]|nr:hypothetical protein [Planctomycetota bacterium]
MRCFAAALALLLAGSLASADTRGFKVTTDRTVDPSSLETIVRDVWVRSGAKSDDEKAIAIYEYLHNTIFHWAYATEVAPQSVGPLKLINVYGWGLCGGQHTVLKALYETAGWKCRYVGWPGHTTIEVEYGGKWHYFDVFLKCYYWSKDKSHVVGQGEIADDPSIVLDAVKDGRAARQNLCCGDEPQGVVEGCKARNTVGESKGWASVTWRDENYSTSLTLPSGAALRLDWKSLPDAFAITGKAPQHSCSTKDFREDKVLGPVLEHYGTRNWSDGSLVYAPDFSKAADVSDLELTGAAAKGGKLVATGGTGVAVFKLALPYAYVGGTLAATFDGDGRLSVSTDGGKSWTPAAAGDVSPLLKQRYDVRVKAEFAGALASFKLDAVVEHNRSALPFLLPGKNVVTVATEKNELPKDKVLVVTYAYQEAAAPEKRNRYDGNGLKYGDVKTVQKEVTALPFTFDVQVGGNTPPKMISLERSLRAK